MRIGLAQINVSVGDINGNRDKILEYIESAKDLQLDVICFPELAITGYPPEDLLLKPHFIQANMAALNEVKKATGGLTVIVGFAERGEDLFNSAAILHDKKLVDVYRKHYLPNYGVFDENRYFQSGVRVPVYSLGDIKFGVNICEDIWYPGDPARRQAVQGGAQIIFNISSSPYYASKVQSREHMLVTRAKDYTSIVVFCNVVGGQDELVFDGHSIIIGERGDILARAGGFEEELLVAELSVDHIFRSRLHDPRQRKEQLNLQCGPNRVETIKLDKIKNQKKRTLKLKSHLHPYQNGDQEMLSALTLGTRDYLYKNGFKKAVIGLSGGIDSALVAAIAVEALGGDNVVGVSMPSMHSSPGSISDSEHLADNLGVKLLHVPIKGTYEAYIDMFSGVFKGVKQDITEENLQARIRGNILMSLSNKFGWLVLTTGNKSEMSVGYCTLYGDMAGGFAVIKDVPKTIVYKLCEFYNNSKGSEVIPNLIITKPPSAELRPGQLDSDSLPPYDVLDPILKAYVENDLSVQEIISLGYKKQIVSRVIKLVDRNEYKRRQAPPGIKITSRAFGKDRRFPITNLYNP